MSKIHNPLEPIPAGSLFADAFAAGTPFRPGRYHPEILRRVYIRRDSRAGESRRPGQGSRDGRVRRVGRLVDRVAAADRCARRALVPVHRRRPQQPADSATVVRVHTHEQRHGALAGRWMNRAAAARDGQRARRGGRPRARPRVARRGWRTKADGRGRERSDEGSWHTDRRRVRREGQERRENRVHNSGWVSWGRLLWRHRGAFPDQTEDSSADSAGIARPSGARTRKPASESLPGVHSHLGDESSVNNPPDRASRRRERRARHGRMSGGGLLHREPRYRIRLEPGDEEEKGEDLQRFCGQPGEWEGERERESAQESEIVGWREGCGAAGRRKTWCTGLNEPFEIDPLPDRHRCRRLSRRHSLSFSRSLCNPGAFACLGSTLTLRTISTDRILQPGRNFQASNTRSRSLGEIREDENSRDFRCVSIGSRGRLGRLEWSSIEPR